MIAMEMQQKVWQFIENEIKIAPKSRIVVGVSGGADSVAMLHVLRSLGYECIAAHCNFHLRGAESDRDEYEVRKLSAKLQVSFVKTDFDTVNYAKKNKISIEMAARELRYSWFESVRQKQQAKVIAVAHHIDDSIETFLLNLIRGSGLRGLKGIEPVNDNVTRPLLCTTREEIVKYVTENELNHIIDSSNENIDFLRNKVRLQLLPLLAEFNPSIRQTLQETIERMRGTWKVFEHTTEKIKSEIATVRQRHLYIDINKLQKQPDIKTVLFEILQPYHFHGDIIEQITENLDNESGLKFYSENYILIKDRDFLILSEKKGESDLQITIPEYRSKIEYPVWLIFEKKNVDNNFDISKNKNTVHIDLDKIKFPLTLRKWQNGDYFYPFGMKNRKKISDFLIDRKINILDKQNTWLLISDNQVVWIVGERLDNRFGVTQETTRVLEISLSEK